MQPCGEAGTVSSGRQSCPGRSARQPPTVLELPPLPVLELPPLPVLGEPLSPALAPVLSPPPPSPSDEQAPAMLTVLISTKGQSTYPRRVCFAFTGVSSSQSWAYAAERQGGLRAEH